MNEPTPKKRTRRSHGSVLPNCSTKTSPASIRRSSHTSSLRKWLKGAEYMNNSEQLEAHAHDELKHALIISRQIDYLGKMPSVTPKPLRTSDKPKDMLRFDLENENETIRQYRDRIRGRPRHSHS